MALALFYQLDTLQLRRMVLDIDKSYMDIVQVHRVQPDEGVIELDDDKMPSLSRAQNYIIKNVS